MELEKKKREPFSFGKKVCFRFYFLFSLRVKKEKRRRAIRIGICLSKKRSCVGLGK